MCIQYIGAVYVRLVFTGAKNEQCCTQDKELLFVCDCLMKGVYPVASVRMNIMDSTAVRFRRDLLEWADEGMREFPWRESSASLYEVLMAEFFLSRTRAQVVARVIPEFLEEFPDFEAIRDAEKERIAEVIRPTGLQNRRAEALKELAATIDDDIPRNPDELMELPRVGQYVAHATLCFALGEPLFIRDTNVTRIFDRLLGDDWPDSEEEQDQILQESVPEDAPRLYNLALLDFGAEVCTARSPRCEDCFAAEYCAYYNEEVAA